ncbi:hypothetical protein IRJ41_015349 [Triplophysa rosa]|uniref:Uncharacterized protein n=1 Tax=Triplophysa rosa TaxID=992332 RepID=A0A9W7TCP8_TRIRA|nr:hypothetical protein IRJ41_015349 [Triplophysa rosa]
MIKMSLLTLLAVLLHFYSWAAAADVDNDIVSQEVMEGNNFTISTKLPKLDTDPQSLFTLVNGTSEVPLAQLTCHFLKCLPNYWTSGVLLEFNEENVTLILLKITRSQTGLYKVRDLSSQQPKDKCFNVTVYVPPPEPPPSSRYTDAPVIVATIGFIVIVVAIIIGVIFFKCRRASFISD